MFNKYELSQIAFDALWDGFQSKLTVKVEREKRWINRIKKHLINLLDKEEYSEIDRQVYKVVSDELKITLSILFKVIKQEGRISEVDKHECKQYVWKPFSLIEHRVNHLNPSKILLYKTQVIYYES